jgi:hypothetical protein
MFHLMSQLMKWFLGFTMVCVVGSFDVYQCVRMVYVPKYPELKFVRMVYVYL